MKLFIMALIFIGLIIIIFGHNKLVTAVFLLYLSMLINYIKTLGLLILWTEKGYNPIRYALCDFILSFIIAFVFGCKFITLHKHVLVAAVLYISIWIIYCRYLWVLLKNHAANQ